MVEDAQRRYSSRVEGVLFTGPSKLIMARAGKEQFEHRTVRIREGDVPLQSDLHKLRKVASATGAPHFVAERDDNHADRTWAAFLAIHAAGGGAAEYGYRAMPRVVGVDVTSARRDRRVDDYEADDRRGPLYRRPLGTRLRAGF